MDKRLIDIYIVNDKPYSYYNFVMWSEQD
jgi:hypothetical protein